VPVTLAIKWVDFTNPDPIADLAGSYKAGDIIVADDPARVNGTEVERPPAQGGNMVRVTITDRDPAAARAYMAEYLNASGVTTRRRAYRLALDELPVAVRNQLETTGQYSANWNAVKGFIEHKIAKTREK
jgi:hypothetical protein